MICFFHWFKQKGFSRSDGWRAINQSIRWISSLTSFRKTANCQLDPIIFCKSSSSSLFSFSFQPPGKESKWFPFKSRRDDEHTTGHLNWKSHKIICSKLVELFNIFGSEIPWQPKTNSCSAVVLTFAAMLHYTLLSLPRRDITATVTLFSFSKNEFQIFNFFGSFLIICIDAFKIDFIKITYM